MPRSFVRSGWHDEVITMPVRDVPIEITPLKENEPKVRAAQVLQPTTIGEDFGWNTHSLKDTGVATEAAEAFLKEAQHVATSSESQRMAPERGEWPEPMATEAFHGIAGEYVLAVEPHTEADSAGLLVQLLVGFGSLIGRSAHFSVEAAHHFGNLFCVLVGDSSKGRKGTSWSHVRRALESIDQEFADACIQEGLSSGEGLCWSVRDQIERSDPIKEKGRVIGYETVIADEGVSDKRLLVMESEFASPLRVANRDGNTLSCVVRQAWDGGNLRLLTKNNPAKATGAHISILGHITKDELVRHITTTDLGNGYANRFLWVCTRRSKHLPEGGQVPVSKLAPILERLKEAAKFAKTMGVAEREPSARALWYAVYPDLSEGGYGLLGAVTNRAEAQVVRLSLLYALLDLSKQIRVEHLKAALAVWSYCEASARTVFGDAFGDSVVDELLSVLKRSGSGMTRTEIRDFFGRNRSSGEIERALGVLNERGFAHRIKETETGGRPSERWCVTTRTAGQVGQ
jgi:Protein of unknown function (DUF3987)